MSAIGGWHIIEFGDGSLITYAQTKLTIGSSGATSWGSGFFYQCRALSIPQRFESIDGCFAASFSSALWHSCGASASSKDKAVTFYLSSLTARGANEELPALVVVTGKCIP